MENLKVRVSTVAESEEAQALFKQLGYKIEHFIPNVFPRWVVTTNKGLDYWYSTGLPLIKSLDGYKEVTLPKLRDMAVLRLNDVNDVTHKVLNTPHHYYLTSDKKVYGFNDKWNPSVVYPVSLSQIEQEQGFIRGADAKTAWSKGESLDYRMHSNADWLELDDSCCLGIFNSSSIEFRLKPRTIKLELEIPAPFKPKNNQQIWVLDTQKPCGYKSIIHHIGCEHDLCWETEKQTQEVVDALRSVLNGTEQSQ